MSAVIHVVHHDDYENQAPIAVYTDRERADELVTQLDIAGNRCIGVTTVPLDGAWQLLDRFTVTRTVAVNGDAVSWHTDRADHLSPVVVIDGKAIDQGDGEWSHLDHAGFRQLPASPALAGNHDTSRGGTTITARAQAFTVERAQELADARILRAFELAGMPIGAPT